MQQLTYTCFIYLLCLKGKEYKFRNVSGAALTTAIFIFTDDTEACAVPIQTIF